MSVLVFDIGASRTRIGITDSESILKKEIFETPKKFDEAISVIFSKSETLLDGVEPDKIIIGIAGPMDANHEKLLDSNLSDFINKPVKKVFKEKYGENVEIYNDTILAGLGEAVYGAGKDKKIVSYLTVSSGVNGVRIIDRKVDENRSGFEIGKQMINFPENRNLESYVGGVFLERRYGDLVKLEDRKVWEKIEKILSIGIANTLLYWSPDILILGGGVMNKINIENINKNVKILIGRFFNVADIVRSEFPDFGGLYGGLFKSLPH